jgi:Tfp pilus assembly protein PilZ
VADLETPCLELRVPRLADLRDAWLDGFADGGLFIPGAAPLSTGARVAVRVTVDEAPALETLLTGVVAFRDVPGADAVRRTGTRLVPGVGVIFDAAMRPRVVFLERAARGVLPEHPRRSQRWPLRAYGELLLRPEERAREAEIVDVSARGAQIELPDGPAFVARGAAVRVWVAFAPSGESSFSPLAARVAWLAVDGMRLGVELQLGSEADRIHWERVVARARGAFERRLARPSLTRLAAV